MPSKTQVQALLPSQGCTTRTNTRRLDQTDIDRAQAVSIANIARERGFNLKKQGQSLAGPCPRCTGRDRFSVNITRNLWNCRGCSKGGDSISLIMFLDEVRFRPAVVTLIGEQNKPRSNAYAPAPARNLTDYGRVQHEKGRYFWSQRKPISGSPAETYLRSRGITCPLPATLAYLAWGLRDESEPERAMVSELLRGLMSAEQITFKGPSPYIAQGSYTWSLTDLGARLDEVRKACEHLT